jgi:hypothetical protein
MKGWVFVHKEYLQRRHIQLLNILETNYIITVLLILYIIQVYNFNQNV